MEPVRSDKIASYLRLLHRHRGETKGAYDEVASVYDDFANVWDNHVAGAALTYFTEILGERVKPGAVVLDAGSGTGERTQAILTQTRPAQVVALDASPGMMAVAQNKIQNEHVDFVQGDISTLPFPDNTFDVVACTWVVEIMAEPKRVVEEYVRVIKPDGFVVYAFCSLPEGKVGDWIKYFLDKVPLEKSHFSHHLAEGERPFHRCQYSSLQQFAGGLVTVATVAKCCPITDASLPCRLELS